MKPDFDKILDTSNPHLVRRWKAPSEPTVKIKHERSLITVKGQRPPSTTFMS